MGRIRVGLSGWDYDHWAGEFYPADLTRAERLRFVGERFDAVEVNGSFYGLLSPRTYRRWSEATPRGFRFALKGSRFILHNKKLKDVMTPLANFFASGPLVLGSKLGPILWQLPDRHRFDAERLRAFVELLPADTEEALALGRRHDERVEDVYLELDQNHRIHHALEVRNESFFCDEAARILRDRAVALAVSHAGHWPLREQITAGFAYIRLHGAPATYESGYDQAALECWSRRARRWRDGEEPEDAARFADLEPPHREGRDVWIFFDNDAAVRAPRDAEALAELCARN